MNIKEEKGIFKFLRIGNGPFSMKVEKHHLKENIKTRSQRPQGCMSALQGGVPLGKSWGSLNIHLPIHKIGVIMKPAEQLYCKGKLDNTC